MVAVGKGPKADTFVERVGKGKTPSGEHRAASGWKLDAETKPALSEDRIVFVVTSTPEKIDHFNRCARANQWPIHFLDARQHIASVFHIPPEEMGDTSGNAKVKLNDAAVVIDRLKKSPSARRALKERVESLGIQYNEDHIAVAVEDSAGGVTSRKIWDEMDKSGIPADVLARIESPRNNIFPGVELAPTMSALLGPEELMRRLRESADRVQARERRASGEKSNGPIAWADRSLMRGRLLSSGTNSSFELEGDAKLYLLNAPSGPLPEHPYGESTYRWLRMKKVEGSAARPKSCAEMGEEYITKHGPRYQLVDALAEDIFQLKGKDRRPPAPLKGGKDFNVRFVKFDPALSNGIAPVADTHEFDAHKEGVLAFPSTHSVLGEMERLIEGGDAFVLLPDAPGSQLSEADRLRKGMTLFSLEVAKQIVARDGAKPIIVVNHNGCWDDALAMDGHLARKGMVKHYVFSPEQKKQETKRRKDAVQVSHNGVYYTLSGTDLDQLMHKTQAILEKERAGYIRHEPALADKQKYESHGTPPSEFGGYKVGVFLSAGCENDELCRSTRRFCHDLAKQGFGIIWGAGDQHMMGEVLNGYQDYERETFKNPSLPKSYIAGYSTPELTGSETRHGKPLEGLSYSKITRDIYERMSDMIEASDTIVIKPGGAGTMQEWIAPLLVKQMLPERMKDKKIVIWSPSVHGREEHFYDPILKTMLGSRYDAIMGEAESRERPASAQEGVYVAHDKAEVERLVNGFRQEWRMQKNVASRWDAGRGSGGMAAAR